MRTVRGNQPDCWGGASRTDLKVYGLKDATAAQAAYDALGQLEGVHQILVDIPLRRITVAHAPQPGMAQAIVGVLRGIGFRAQQKR